MVDRQPYTFDRVIRILFGVVSVVGLFYLVYILRGALLPFLVAWIVAYMLNPLVVYNKRVFKLKGRVVAITLAFLEVLITISLLCVLFLPSIIDEIAHMRELLSEYVYNSSSIPFVRNNGSRLSRRVFPGLGASSPVRWAKSSIS